MVPSLAKNVGARKLLVKSKPTFLVDGMLGSVARKLRFFGLDTLYMSDSPDEEIIRTGINQKRVILTCDKELYGRIMKARTEGILLNGSDDLEDIAQTFFSYGMMLVSFMKVNSRCSICNALLAEREYADVKGRIPSNIINRDRRFFECKNCNKLYWEGSHYASLMALSKRIDSRINELLEEHKSYATERLAC